MATETSTIQPAHRHTGTREIRSEVLFQGRREIVIRHNGQDYRLRITANEKLILTR